MQTLFPHILHTDKYTNEITDINLKMYAFNFLLDCDL